jgi:hypothetical protein
MQKASGTRAGPSYNVNLSVQHFVHVLCMLRYLRCEGPLSQYAVVDTVQNLEHLQRYFRVEDSTREKLLTVQKQNSLFLSMVFDHPVLVATMENVICEEGRDTSSFTAMDVVYPIPGTGLH